MLFFNKRIEKFLLEAKEEKIISSDIYDKLSLFREGKINKSVVFNLLNNGLYLIGGFLLILGMILIISHNWNKINDIVKLLVYLAIQNTLFISAFKVKTEKISKLLYFLGCGTILGGIGLVAQIYNLYSSNGTAFLMWFAMILPFIIYTRQKSLFYMGILAFYTWLNIFALDINLINENTALIYFFTSFSNIYILIEKNDDILAKMLKTIYFTSGLIWTYIAIIINFRDLEFNFLLNNYEYFLYLFFLAEIGYLLISIIKFKKINIEMQKYVLLVIYGLLFLIVFKSFFIYSIFMNIFWVLFSCWLIYLGILNNEKKYINFGLVFIFIYIITKFFDYFSNMLNSGISFVTFGIFLILMVYFFNKSKTAIYKIIRR